MLRPRTIFEDLVLFPVRTPTLPPATHTNCYALGRNDVLLVEPATPYEDEGGALLDWVRTLALLGRRVVAIVLTHHHADHVGGAAFFARELGVPLWAHAETQARLSHLAFARTLSEGDVIGEAGARAPGYRVLYTPGHAPGHVCLFDEARGVLVAGDMVASKGTILIEPTDGDMQVYLRELERLRGLGAKIVLPAHGDPIDDPAELFGRYIAHRLMREARVLAAVRAHPFSTAEELVPDAYADTPSGTWPLALLSLRAHLIKLTREGRVREDMSRFVAGSTGGPGLS